MVLKRIELQGYQLKVLHLCLQDHMGAGRAAANLHRALGASGVDSWMLVSRNRQPDPHTLTPGGWRNLYKKVQTKWANALSRIGLGCQTTFSCNVSPTFLAPDIKRIRPDVIHVHWVGWDYLRIEDFCQLGAPIVLTMNDMWAFTGGCHFSGECTQFEDLCLDCPQIRGYSARCIALRVQKRKERAWSEQPFPVIAPSRWIQEKAARSRILRHRNIVLIPHGIQPEWFSPPSRADARTELNLPLDGRVILLGSINPFRDPRKGFPLLLKALKRLSAESLLRNVSLAVFGADELPSEITLPLPCRLFGFVSNQNVLRRLYAAADLYVLPSLAENLPKTALEASACGIPVVAFNVGGLSDIVEHCRTGYLAPAGDSDGLAQGIRWALYQDARATQEVSAACTSRMKEHFSLENQVNRCMELYAKVHTCPTVQEPTARVCEPLQTPHFGI